MRRPLFRSNHSSYPSRATPTKCELDIIHHVLLRPRRTLPDAQRQHRLIKSRGHEHATPALSVAWSHLSVRGLGGKDDLQFAPTVGSILSGPYAGFQDKKRKQKLSNAREQQERDAGEYDEGLDNQSEKQGGKGKGGKKGKGLGKGERYLIKDFSGVVKAGEMMLVVVSAIAGP